MSVKVLNGVEVAEGIKRDTEARIRELNDLGIKPGLAAVLVGDNQASKVYVASKVRACQALGLHSERYELSAETTTRELLRLVIELNARDEVDGILIQLPLPAQIDTHRILEAVDPAKDVDGFHPVNVGRLVRGVEALVACTPAGVIEMLDYYQIPDRGFSCGCNRKERHRRETYVISSPSSERHGHYLSLPDARFTGDRAAS